MLTPSPQTLLLTILLLAQPSLAQAGSTAAVAQQKLLGEAQALLATGRPVEAEPRAAAAVAANDKNPRAWNVLGQVRFARKMWKEAALAFERALVLLPKDATLHLSAGICYFEWHQLDQAEIKLRRSARLNPRASRPHLFLGRLARARGELKTAEQELRKAFDLDKKDSLTSYYLGLFLLRQSKLTEAAAMFQHCLKVAPDQPSAHLNLGLTLTRMGEKKKGRRHLDRFKRLTEISSEDHRMRIRVASRLRAASADLAAGRLNAALAVVLEAKALAPAAPAVYRFLVAIYTRQDRASDAKIAQESLDRLVGGERKR